MPRKKNSIVAQHAAGKYVKPKAKLINTGTNAFNLELTDEQKEAFAKVKKPAQMDVEELAPVKQPSRSVGRKGGGSSVENNVPTKGGLPPAWNGWPKGERFCIYFSHPNGELICYHKFAACYAAKKFVQVAGNGAEWVLKDSHNILVGDRLVVTTDAASELFKHQLTKQEDAWVLPPPYDGYAARIAGVETPLMQRVRLMAETGKMPVLEGEKASPTPARAAVAARVTRGALIKAPKTVVGSDSTIHLKQKGNPCKAGTKSYAIFACFKEGMTVAEFIKAGQPGWDMKGAVPYFQKRGNIEIREPK